MTKKKHFVAVIFFLLAGLIFLLGICQLFLYMYTQLAMIKEAGAQGAATEQISEYYWQQYMPQVFSYIITTLGFSAVLFSLGMLHQKQDKINLINSPSQKLHNRVKTDSSDNDLDEFYDEFEIVSNEQEKD